MHYGLVASSEENADRFFIDILGLEKSEPKMIDKNVMDAIFGIDNEYLVIRYRGETIDFEVFVQEGYKASSKQLNHLCIQVQSLEELVSKCKNAGARVIQVPRGSRTVTFISDFDGNLYEVKE
jgi:catechol 2,3-dioxygenase-like lactoylglutathione lyase family enzyme